MGSTIQNASCECHLGQGNEAGSLPSSSHSGRCLQGVVGPDYSFVSVSPHTHPAENSLEEVTCTPPPPPPHTAMEGLSPAPALDQRSDYAVETNIKSLLFCSRCGRGPQGDREPGRCLQHLPSRSLLLPRTLLPLLLTCRCTAGVNNQKDELTTV